MLITFCIFFILSCWLELKLLAILHSKAINIIKITNIHILYLPI